MFTTRWQLRTWMQACQIKKLANVLSQRTLSQFILVLVGFMSCSVPVQAQSYKPLTESVVDSPSRDSRNNSQLLAQYSPLHRIQVDFIPPPLPGGQEAPGGRRRGGASRCSECKHNDLRLTALVPGNHSESFLALTAAEHPTFWVYVPNVLTLSDSIEFVLQDAADNYIYQTTFTTPETPSGVINLPLPRGVAPLEVGKRYHWTFLVKESSNSVFVQGSVQRIALDPSLKRQLEVSTLPERVALYAANGIWHEALTTLAELHRTNPQNTTLTASWVNLLDSVGLRHIATEPVVQCCTPKPTTALK